MPHTHAKPSQAGFTLIEMLIIAPMIILLIASIIGYITVLTGDSLRMKERNAAGYAIQETLSRIEEDTARATAFITTTGSVASPQGKNDATQAFTYATSNAATLILQSPATTANPFDATRQIVYKNTPNACANKANNATVTYNTVYFVKGTDLWRRVILDRSTSDKCDLPWQRPSCAPANVPSAPSSTSSCQAKDEKLLSNVVSFTTTYYDDDTEVTPNPPVSDPATPMAANAVAITLQTSQTIANETIVNNGSLRVTSVNR